jgi:DNA-binding transcriptional LysR family regulator
VVEELRQAQEELSTLQSEPMGHLRVSLPLALGSRLIAPQIPELLKRYPKISMELDLSVEKVDVFTEQIDVAVRIAESLGDGLVAVRLAPYRRVFCASPDYLARRGTPCTPQDLASHDLLLARGASSELSWPVMQDGVVRSLPVHGRLIVNNGEPIYDAAVAGLGICMQARWRVEADLREGRLVAVLPEHVVNTRSIWAVLSQRGAMTPKVRVLVDFLRGRLAELA